MKTLLYAPMVYREGKGFWPPTISSCWYFQWQKELWSYFSRQKGLKIIWKAWHTSNLKDPIRGWEASNIRYSTRRIWREIRQADFVFVDYPSSIMLDASKKGKPCLCITHERDKRYIRKDCLDALSILIVHDIKEAIQLLNDWIWSEKDRKEISLHKVKLEGLIQ